MESARPALTRGGVLVCPGWAYHSTFSSALREFHADGHYLNWPAIKNDEDFANFLGRMRAAYENPFPGYVPERCFWLIDDEQLRGVLHFRHPLNHALRQFGGNVGYTIRPNSRDQGYGKRILQLGLLEVWRAEPALSQVLLTCYEDNPASARIIESNGGQLEDVIRLPSHPQAIRHYWIQRSSL